VFTLHKMCKVCNTAAVMATCNFSHLLMALPFLYCQLERNEGSYDYSVLFLNSLPVTFWDLTVEMLTNEFLTSLTARGPLTSIHIRPRNLPERNCLKCLAIIL
jgi:hypothetical protein